MRLILLSLLLSLSCSEPTHQAALDQGPEDLIRVNLDLSFDAALQDSAALDHGAPDATPPDQGASDSAVALDSATLDGAARDADDARPEDAGTEGPWLPFGLLSLNLHCLKLEGTPFESNQARMAFIAGEVRARGIKALALQELCVQGEVSSLRMLREALEAETGLPWSEAWAFAHVGWEGTPDEADEGLGFLVQGELQAQWEHLYLNQGPLRRVALGVTLPPELGGFDLYTLHLDYDASEARDLQAWETAVVALLRRADAQVIIAGDLNSPVGSAPHSALQGMGFEYLNVGLDPRSIDHALAHRAAGLQPSEAELLFTEAARAVSDHPGLYLTLSPAPAQAACRTEIRAYSDPGVGRALSLRGEGDPLSWARGIPLINTAPGAWSLALTEISEGFEYKLLLDDEGWQLGENQAGTPCVLNEVTPGF